MLSTANKIKVVLLGSSGAIGKIIKSTFINDKRFHLVSVVRNLSESYNNDTEIFNWDFKTYSKDIVNLFKSSNIIINATGKKSGSNSEVKNINLDFIISLMGELLKTNSKTRFIQISSAGAYGACSSCWLKKIKVCEKLKDSPGDYYEQTKSMADSAIISKIKKASKLSYTILRPTNVITHKNSNLLRYVSFFIDKNFYFLLRKNSMFNFLSGSDLADIIIECCLNLRLTRNQIFIISDDCTQLKLFNFIDSKHKNKRYIIKVPFFLSFIVVKFFIFFKITQRIAKVIMILSSRISYDSSKIKKILKKKTDKFTKNPILHLKKS
jgi:nucleoside-diphosphate-sugar epimerase